MGGMCAGVTCVCVLLSRTGLAFKGRVVVTQIGTVHGLEEWPPHELRGEEELNNVPGG